MKLFNILSCFMEIKYYKQNGKYLMVLNSIDKDKQINIIVKENEYGVSLTEEVVSEGMIEKSDEWESVDKDSLFPDVLNDLQNIIFKYLSELEQKIISREFFPNQKGNKSTLPIFLSTKSTLKENIEDAKKLFGNESLAYYNGKLYALYSNEEWDNMTQRGKDAFNDLVNRSRGLLFNQTECVVPYDK